MDTEIITAATGGRVSVLPLLVRPPLALLLSARTLGSRKPDMHTDIILLANGRPKSEVRSVQRSDRLLLSSLWPSRLRHRPCHSHPPSIRMP
jgi:hypothetical protein